MQNSNIHIYSDGACLKNPGPGGYAGIILSNNSIKVISGFFEDTTNNRMELSAATESFSYFANPDILSQKISIFTDSQYVKNGITNWIFNWKKNNWKTANGSSVKNQSLWEKLYHLNQNLKPEWNWVKGHSDNLYNNVVDFIATTVAKSQKSFDLFEDYKLLLKEFPEMEKFLVIN